MSVLTRQRVRFGPFELDRASGELFKLGHNLNLHGQPVEVLSILLERPGEVVTREELCHRLWPEDTFVDFEHSLNTAIKKLRQALDDEPDAPRYIETLPKKGYRFIARVESVPKPTDPIAGAVNDVNSPPAELQTTELATPIETPLPPKPRRWRYALGAALVVILIAAALYEHFRPRTPVVTGIHQLTSTGYRKSYGFGYLNGFLPQSDGTRVYFGERSGGRWNLAQVSTKGGEVSYLDTPLLQIPSVADISNDGAELLLEDAIPTGLDGPFSVFPTPAGPARKLPGMFRLMEFLPGSNQIVYIPAPDRNRLFVAKLDGSEARPLMSLPGEIGLSFAISPDGKRVRFATTDNKMWESHLDGTGLHRILAEFNEPVCCGHWNKDGRLYVFASQEKDGYNLWGVSESTFLGYRSISRPVRLTNGPISFRFSITSRNGRQIFARGELLRGELSIYDANSGRFQSYLNGISAGALDFSRDGQWVTYVTHPQGSLWRSRVNGSERLQLTFPPMGPIINPRWSPDGRFIAFTEWTDLNRKIYLVPADGGAPLLVLSGDFQPADPTWSPDGKSVMYGGQSLAEFGSENTTEIRILNLETRQSKIVPGSRHMYSPRWSPDGRHIAAISEDQKQLFLYTFALESWRHLPLPQPLSVGWPFWSQDSRYLYVANGFIYKLRISDGRAELAVPGDTIGSFICPAIPFGRCPGLTPDERIVVMLNRGVDEIYALDLEYR